MDERFKQRDKHKTGSKLESKSKFKDFSLKTKESTFFQRLQSTDFASNAKIKFKNKIDFKDAGNAQEIKIKSTSADLKVGFAGVAGTYSGYFYAQSDSSNPLLAILEDEADTVNEQLTFQGNGYLKTHIVPLGVIGDVALFKVIDQETGDEAQAEAITIPLYGGGLVKFFKNLFR